MYVSGQDIFIRLTLLRIYWSSLICVIYRKHAIFGLRIGFMDGGNVLVSKIDKDQWKWLCSRCVFPLTANFTEYWS